MAKRQSAPRHANAQRGEMALQADGHTYVLVIGINALCVMETPGPHNPSGRKFRSILGALRQDSLLDARLLLWAALQTHHAEEFQTVDAVGALLDRIGGTKGLLSTAVALVNQLVALSVPEGPPAGAKGAPAGTDPRTTNGTGASST